MDNNEDDGLLADFYMTSHKKVYYDADADLNALGTRVTEVLNKYSEEGYMMIHYNAEILFDPGKNSSVKYVDMMFIQLVLPEDDSETETNQEKAPNNFDLERLIEGINFS